MSVDRRGHIWIIHRPRGIRELDLLAETDPPSAKCCVAAPSVIEFDPDGKVLRAWGAAQGQEWFDSEHAIHVDTEDNVWLLGAGAQDGLLLKFSMEGELLLRIGNKGEFRDADDTAMLGSPSDMLVDTKRREVFVADGYRNHRVIVFDADTGAFKRQWTAYGRPVEPDYFTGRDQPDFSRQGPMPEHFTTVHCVTKIGDEIFVCDRANDRLQVFTPQGEFIREIFFNRSMAGIVGSTWDAAPVPGRSDALLVLDGINSEFALLDIQTGSVLASYRNKGPYPGQMIWPHQLAVDQFGRVYVTEVAGGARVQRFLPVSSHSQ